MKFKKDTRNKLWVELERDVQTRARAKDRRFALTGRWKKFVRNERGFRIYAVDGEWVRNNLSIIFGHGGHGYVHEFIPAGEIWIGVRHPADCGCRNVRGNRGMSWRAFESAVLHEIVERREMGKGVAYWRAHQIALQKEREAGFLEDPYTEASGDAYENLKYKF